MDKRQFTHCALEDMENWLPTLRSEVQRVLRHLHVLSSPVVIPLGVIIEELDDLLAHCRSSSLDRNYISLMLCEAQVGQHEVLEAYLDLVDRSVTWSPDQQLHVLSSLSALLADWMQTAERYALLAFFCRLFLRR